MSEELLDLQVTTEAEAIANLAGQPRIERSVETPTIAALPPGWTSRVMFDESLLSVPTRHRGTVFVHDAASFVAMVNHRSLEDSGLVVYADEAVPALVAVLNDDANDYAGWRDYRVELQLRPTPEWSHWIRRDGAPLDQDTFAQHIEDGLAELSDPDPATMLELAQTFHATTSANFKGGTRLASGARQFRYEEAIDASAGEAGTLEIPERLKITVAPFYGASRYEVGAWFRFRLTRDNFTLGYKLDRPHDIVRAAFNDVRVAVESELPHPFVLGPAPAPVIGELRP